MQNSDENKKSQLTENKDNFKSNEKSRPETSLSQKISKSITIDLQKEYEEDKEILDLLEGKRNYIIYININV